MSDRAKILRVTAIISSSLILLTFIIILIINGKDGLIIYPYFPLLISIMPCIILWKMCIDEKKHDIK